MSSRYYLINFVPGILLLVPWWFKPNLRFGLLKASLTIFILANIFLLNFMIAGVVACTRQYTSPKDYGAVLKSLGYPNNTLIKHFPEEIPPTSKNVRLYYSPQFLQGGGRLQLWLQMSPEQTRNTLKRFESRAIYIQNGCTSSTEAINEDIQVALASFRSADNKEFADLPKDYKVIVLDSKPYKKMNWNHGYSSGVAICENNCEVIYWTEFW